MDNILHPVVAALTERVNCLRAERFSDSQRLSDATIALSRRDRDIADAETALDGAKQEHGETHS